MEAMNYLIRALKGTSSAVITIALAIAIGFGVPVAWLFAASKLYGSTEAVTGSVALFIGTGILVSYLLVLLAASWIRARLGHGQAEAGQYKRAAWNRSLRDETKHLGSTPSDPIERFVVATAIVVIIGFFVWFAVFAGDPYSGKTAN